MRSIVYSRWDGSQAEFTLDADSVLDHLSDLLMEGLSVEEALEWMRRSGFELGGLDMRVMGTEELIDELRQQTQSLYDRYDMDAAEDDLQRRFDDILNREQEALVASSGFESARLNDFLDRRHSDAQRLSDAIERFRDHDFEDEEAGDDYRELLDEIDRMRKLEDFLEEQGERFGGSEQADYETA